jgi:hypothetical protein
MAKRQKDKQWSTKDYTENKQLRKTNPIGRNVLTAVLAPGKSSAMGPLPTQPVSWIKL